jgi:nicotinate-nucleotide pyrophosphorylase (carboxylating)
VQALNAQEVEAAVRAALAEDLGGGDVTTEATVPADLVASARLMARESLVFAGSAFVECAFLELDPAARFDFLVAEGQPASRGAVIASIRGKARALLSAERVALNFAQRLSGIATLTARFVAQVRGTHARILDTRKTTPGWRRFEKHAVACGGGQNHRFGLHDLILIKDNHLESLAGEDPNPVAVAVRRARAYAPALRVEVEADTLEQAVWAAEAGADIVLLDNMTPETLREAVRLVAGRCQCEASGGITLDTVRSVAETGVDFISVGALTHSPRSVDLALDFDPLTPPLRGNSPE